MTYIYFDLYDTNPFGYRYIYRMFDDIAPASNNLPQVGQIYP